MTMETETGGRQPPAQQPLEPQKLDEAGRTLRWSLWRDTVISGLPPDGETTEVLL